MMKAQSQGKDHEMDSSQRELYEVLLSCQLSNTRLIRFDIKVKHELTRKGKGRVKKKEKKTKTSLPHLLASTPYKLTFNTKCVTDFVFAHLFMVLVKRVINKLTIAKNSRAKRKQEHIKMLWNLVLHILHHTHL